MPSPPANSSRSLGHRAPLLWLVLPFMVGIASGDAEIEVSARDSLGAALVLATLGLVWRGSTQLVRMLCLVLSVFLAGFTAYAIAHPSARDWTSRPPREARLSVKIERTFGQSDPRRWSALGRIVGANGLSELIGHRVYVSLTLQKAQVSPIRSAIIFASGVLTALPPNPPTDTFEGYLSNAGINFQLKRGKLLREEQPPSSYGRFCAKALTRLSDILGEGVLEKRPKLVGIYRAMLLGQQSDLTQEQSTIFRESGTMHVFSISGLHIAVIAAGLHSLLALLRLPAVVRFVVGLSALWLYVDITGLAPSAVRAFVMVAVIESAILLRVPRNPISALAASALVVLLFDPLQMFSASFQMSYGIVAALLLMGLPLADRAQQALQLFRYLPPATWSRTHRWVDWLWRGTVSAAAIGGAASLVGAITGITFFKLFTPGAFFVNLWLIPASGAVLYMGLISLLCGLAGFTAGTVLANHAAVLLLWGIEAGVRVIVKVPVVWFAGTYNARWIGPSALILLLASIVFCYGRRWQGWSGGYWVPCSIVLLVFCFGVTFQ